MKLVFEKSECKGRIVAPPSKSMMHRYLLCAALSEGKSVIHHVAPGDDIEATLRCIETLGATYERDEDTITVFGCGMHPSSDAMIFPCNESGSTLRFFLPISLLYEDEKIFKGAPSLLNRPLSVYEDICKSQAISYQLSSEELRLKGKLHGGIFEIPGNVSSQFISGLLFALPLLSEDSEIRMTSSQESAPYVDLTLQALAQFSVRISKKVSKDQIIFSVPGNQHYKPQEVFTEGDYSQAAFFDALNYLGNNKVVVENLPESSLQGDRIYVDYFAALEKGDPVLHTENCPDLAPVCMVMASLKNGGKLVGTRRLKYKESNRGDVMAEELKKAGAHIQVFENEIWIEPVNLHTPAEPLDGHGDHRVVMALSVLLLVLGGTLKGAEAVQKSFPDYFERLKSIGGKIREESEL